MNYYNELDPYAAQWLRNLIAKGLIPDGKVDERDIKKVKTKEVRNYTQAHFFAGIAGWSYALQLAGWPEDEPVWTGSCPCQPFSIAGKGKGKKDKRHLWPEFRRLIATCLPAIIFGEQVASPLGRAWLAKVRFDLEHIYYWAAFYENLHAVRQAEKEGCLPKILGKIVRRVETVVRRVSAYIRAGMAQESEEVSSKGTSKTPGEGQALSLDLQRYSCCQLPGVQTEEACSQKGACLQSRPTSPRASNTHEQAEVRNDGHPAENSHRGKRSTVQLSLPGSNQSAEGLRVYEYTDRLLRDERTSWKLGRKKSKGGCRGVDEKGEMNVKHTTTERFGRVIEKSVERLRLAGIQIDLEALGYEVGCADLCAAGVGAPHIRQRLWWMADAKCSERRSPTERRKHVTNGQNIKRQEKTSRFGVRRAVGSRLVNSKSGGTLPAEQQGPLPGCQQASSGDHRLGDTGGKGSRRNTRAVLGTETTRKGARKKARSKPDQLVSPGFWNNFDLVQCADDKARRIESSSFPLAFKLPRSVGQNKPWLEAMGLLAKAAESLTGAKRNRIGRLKGYGNAIVPILAAEFIMAYLETRRVNHA